MSLRTGIAWTDATWNPWVGCTKVSQGCANCYMFREQRRFRQNPRHVRRTMPPTFNAPLKWHEPRLVFTCSFSDFFHPAADAWRQDAWAIIRETPHLTFQILTKRPERIAVQLPPDWGVTGYRNVWLGVSVELQRHADRIATLDKIRCLTKFVSAEPLLGPLDLSEPLYPDSDDESFLIDALDWVIAGEVTIVLGRVSAAPTPRPAPPAGTTSMTSADLVKAGAWGRVRDPSSPVDAPPRRHYRPKQCKKCKRSLQPTGGRSLFCEACP